MDEQFYTAYTETCYLEHARFGALPGYLLPEIREELLPNLLENFVHNYESGRSVLCVSY